MNATCPSDFALEESLFDATTAAAGHASSCGKCRDRLARMEEQRVLFMTQVRPATLDHILDHAPGGSATRRRWWSWLGLATAATASAAVLAVVVLPRPAAVTEHAKGSRGPVVEAPVDPLVLQVFVGRAGVARPAANGDAIPADASLRFRVAVPAPCQLAIASIDGTGSVSHLYPSGASAQPLPAGKSDLEGSAQLDGVPGPERLFAVCAVGTLGSDELERAVRAAVGPPGLDAPKPLRLQEPAI